jgi:hypothetical protein
VDDGLVIEETDGGHDAILEFLFGCDADWKFVRNDSRGSTDRGIVRVGGVEQPEEFDEFATAMTMGMNLTADKIDTGQRADRAVAFIFKLPRETRMQAGRGRQIGGGGCNRLDAGLLIRGDDRHRLAWPLFWRCGCLLQDLHFAIDAQQIRHFYAKSGSRGSR